MEHWYSFGDCCIFAVETTPVRGNLTRGSLSRFDDTLLFLHGRYADSETWDPVIRSLMTFPSASFRCVRLDMPGFGRSFSSNGRGLTFSELAELVGKLLKRLARDPEERITIIGHDIGGAIGQLCATRDYDMVKTLILVNSVSLGDSQARLNPGLFGIKALMRLRRTLKLSAIADTAQAQLIMSGWKNRISRWSMLVALNALRESWPRNYERKIWKDTLNRIKKPVLVLRGGMDPLNTLEGQREILALWPHADFFENENAGFWLPIEKPSWLAHRVREFMFKLPRPERVQKALSL